MLLIQGIVISRTSPNDRKSDRAISQTGVVRALNHVPFSVICAFKPRNPCCVISHLKEVANQVIF